MMKLSTKIINNSLLIPLLVIIPVLIANYQVFFTFFHSDDFLHLYQISNWQPLEFIFSSYGGHLYSFRNLIFYLLFQLFGINALPYYSILMATHLACAFILYKIIYLLTDKSVIAAAGTVIWGICPINYGVLAWYSCHGIILVGFFFLLFLYDLVKIEKQKMSLTSTIAIKWSILLALMASSYGSGLIISCLAPIAVVIILWENKNKWKFAAWMLPVIALIMFQFIFKDNIYYYFSGEIQTQKPLSLCNPLNHCGIILEMFVRICTYSIYCMAAFPMLFIPSTRDHPAAPFHVSMPLEYPIAPFLVSILVIIILIECFLHCSDSKKRYLGVLTLFLLCLAFFIALGRAPIYKIVSISIDEASLTPRYYYIIFFITIMILALMADMLINRFPEASKWTGPCILAVIAISIYPSAKLANKIDPWNQFEKEKKIYFETVNEIKKIILNPS